MNWFELVQHRGRSWAIVDAVMNIRFLTMRGISLLHEDLLACQEGVCFMGKLVSWLVG